MTLPPIAGEVEYLSRCQFRANQFTCQHDDAKCKQCYLDYLKRNITLNSIIEDKQFEEVK